MEDRLQRGFRMLAVTADTSALAYGNVADLAKGREIHSQWLGKIGQSNGATQNGTKTGEKAALQARSPKMPAQA